MRMVKVDDFAIPANGMLALKPGGHHLMLFGFNECNKDDTVAGDADNLPMAAPLRSLLRARSAPQPAIRRCTITGIRPIRHQNGRLSAVPSRAARDRSKQIHSARDNFS